eukprot:4831616-Pyramimonas_sp.AAC.2
MPQMLDNDSRQKTCGRCGVISNILLLACTSFMFALLKNVVAAYMEATEACDVTTRPAETKE